jgi:hypothetical protein
MNIKPMIAAAVLSAGFTAVAMGSVTNSTTASDVSAPTTAATKLRLADDTTTTKPAPKHKKKKKKATPPTDTSAPK